MPNKKLEGPLKKFDEELAAMMSPDIRKRNLRSIELLGEQGSFIFGYLLGQLLLRAESADEVYCLVTNAIADLRFLKDGPQ